MLILVSPQTRDIFIWDKKNEVQIDHFMFSMRKEEVYILPFACLPRLNFFLKFLKDEGDDQSTLRDERSINIRNKSK